MATYSYDEAIYGALCYVYGSDDSIISPSEIKAIKSRFLKKRDLSPSQMEVISYRWSKDSDDFYWEVINSLKESTIYERLTAIEIIFDIIKDYSGNKQSRRVPANKIIEDLDISLDEFNHYISIPI